MKWLLALLLALPLQDEKPEARLAALTAEIEKKPTADAYCRRGALLLDLERFDDGLKDFDAAIELDKGNNSPWEKRGAARLRVAEILSDRGGDPEKLFLSAVEDFSQSRIADEARGFMNMGLARAALADHNRSRGKEFVPIAYQAKCDGDDAWNRDKSLVGIFHGRALAYLNVGEMLGEEESLDSALGNSDVEIQMDHKTPAGFALRARIFKAMGRIEEATNLTESTLKAGCFHEELITLLGDRALPTLEAAIKDEKYPAKKERLESLADRIRVTSQRRVELSDLIAKYIELYQGDKPSRIQRAEEWLIQIGEPALGAIDKVAAGATDKKIAQEARNLSRLIRKRAEQNSVRFPVHGAIRRIRDAKDLAAAIKLEFPQAKVELKKTDESFSQGIKEALARHDGWTFVETIVKLPDDDAKRPEDDPEKLTRPAVRSKTVIFKVGETYAVVTFP